MASLQSLPADQRAVVQLVLQRGRSYDDIAALLSIDRAAVRERALSALEALGPEAEIDPGRRALITDYLLGQLPARVSEDVRARLSRSAGERAWARVVGSELAPLASQPLPEIPAGASAPAPAVAAPRRPGTRGAASAPAPAVAAPRRPGTRGASEAPVAAPTRGQAREPSPRSPGYESVPPDRGPEDHTDGLAGQRPNSRLGGAILIGLLAVIVAVVLAVILSSGDSSSSSSSASSQASSPASSSQASASQGPATTATTATGPTKPTAAGAGRPVAQVNLTSPTGNRKIGGVAIVVKQGGQYGILVRGQGVAANTGHNAYAVWLYNSPSDSRILGFINPGVRANGVLQTMGLLPAGASHYKQLLVTLEAQPKPRTPGKIVLQGALSISG